MATTTVKSVTVGGVEYHLPFLDLLPRVNPAKYEEMKQDISATRKIAVRILGKKMKDDFGAEYVLVVDGNHRVLIASELELPSVPADYPAEFELMSEDELRLRALAVNKKRRHLSTEELAELATDMGLSTRAAASELGVPESTIRSAQQRSGARNRAPERSEEKAKGADSKSYPTARKSAEQVAEQVRKAKDLAAEGAPLSAIAKEIGASKGTAHAYVNRPDPVPEPSPEIDPLDGEQLEIEAPPEESGEAWLARQQERISKLAEASADEDEMLCDVCEEPCGDRTFQEGSWIGECCRQSSKHTEVTEPVTSEKKPPKATLKPKGRELKPLSEGGAAERALDRKHGTGAPKKPRAKTTRKPHPFHDLDMENWREIEISPNSLQLFGARRKGPHHSGDYHGNFIPQVPEFILRRYTKRGDVVLDMFAGSGTALVECAALGRHYVGMDLQQKMVDHCRALAAQVPNPDGVTFTIGCRDAREFELPAWVTEQAKAAGSESGLVDHVILHPPYAGIIKFSADPRCLSSAEDDIVFTTLMRAVILNVHKVLNPGKWATLVISEIFSEGSLVDLPGDLQREFEKFGFVTKAKVVKDIQGNVKGKGQNSNLWEYRALDQGFAVFGHEYIIAFQKPLEKGC